VTKTIRLILAFLTMAAGAAFLVTAANSAQASPYGHPFKCVLKSRVRPSGVTVVSLRCSGVLPDGTIQKYQCRVSPLPEALQTPTPHTTCTGPYPPVTSSAPPQPTDQVLVVLHSTPRVLGSFTPDSKGDINAAVSIPRGFTGNHTIEARVVKKTSPAAYAAPDLSAKLVGKTTRVMLPLTVGKAASVSRSSAAALPSTDSSNLGSVAVIGIGALGVVLLAGGGLLMFAGRRRREMI
jgi:hypothetical protein